jgi:predicted ester cyclase
VSAEANKALLRRFYEKVWGSGNYDVADEVFAPDYVRHDFRPGDPTPGPEGQKQIARDFRAAFPDLVFEVELVFGEGDLVVGRWTASGTHTGPWAGVGPTGRTMRFSAANICRFADGKVVEIWNHRDDLGLMQQLGAAVYAGAAA